MTPKVLKGLVETAQRNYSQIEHHEWDGRNYNMLSQDMWREASRIGPSDWWEIIRVLAQGGDYYSIDWTQIEDHHPNRQTL